MKCSSLQGTNKNLNWFYNFLMHHWWDVVIAISHAAIPISVFPRVALVKTYWRNNIYWREIY